MKFLRKIAAFFSKSDKKRHPKMADFSRLTDAEKASFLKYEAKEFAEKYGSVIKALANE